MGITSCCKKEDKDSQQLQFDGTTLSISGGNSVDLSSLLDDTDTDEQTLSLTGQTLSISNGNSVDLSGLFTDTDNQTLTFSGTTLTIENGNSVNLASLLDNTDNQTLSLTGTTLNIAGGNSVNLSSIIPAPQTLTTTQQLIRYQRYSGRSATGTTVQHVREATMTRTAVGQWQVRFTGGTHPDGESYVPVLTAEEESALRDTPDITIVQGTQNASGFDVQITTGDNGGVADVYVDTPWSWSVHAPLNVLTSAVLS